MKTKEKRFTVTADFYLYAHSVNDAIFKAIIWRNTMRKMHDNQAGIISLHETPFASMINNEIDIKQYENYHVYCEYCEKFYYESDLLDYNGQHTVCPECEQHENLKELF
jgi:formylmethanofuran dehydrogenase subunit E